jgi:transcriptional regulator of heat shock response
MLSVRRQNVLQALVNEYVRSVTPVGSKTITSRYMLGVSAATVRNELMWLEESGYALSPHTSAGRIPTNVGYRSFVNSLLLRSQLPSGPQEFLPLAGQGASLAVHDAQEQALQVTEICQALSRHTGNLAVIWAPKVSSTVFHRGLPLLLAQPEFQDAANAIPVVQLLESQGELLEILKEICSVGGLHISIGAENRDAQLYAFSMVASRFALSAGGQAYGVVAVIGPTRMHYRRAIEAVSSAAQALEILLRGEPMQRMNRKVTSGY